MGKRSNRALTALFAVTALLITIPQTAVFAEPADPSPRQTEAAEPAGSGDVRPPQSNPAEPAVTLVAHRAASGGAPEQTAAAMKRAVKLRPDYIEVDVQLSEDGVPVLVHDANFARTTDVESVFPGREYDPIGSFTYREIRRLDAGGWFGDDFAGEKIPTLASVADHVAGTRVGVFVELKNPADSPGLEAAVDKVLDADARWRGVRLTFLSFDASSLHRLDDERPGERLLWITKSVPSKATLEKVAGWADELGADYRGLGGREVNRVHSAGLPLAAYTVNSRAAQSRVVALGVDTLITDYPERAPFH